MFDIGFWELLLIAIVALFVIGPEKIPAFARDAGKWIANIKRFINNTRREIEQELDLNEQLSLKEKISDLDDLMDNAPDRESREEKNNKTSEPGA